MNNFDLLKKCLEALKLAEDGIERGDYRCGFSGAIDELFFDGMHLKPIFLDVLEVGNIEWVKMLLVRLISISGGSIKSYFLSYSDKDDECEDSIKRIRVLRYMIEKYVESYGEIKDKDE